MRVTAGVAGEGRGAVSVESQGEDGLTLRAAGDADVSGTVVRVQGSEATTVRGGEVRVESDTGGVAIGSGSSGSGAVVVQGMSSESEGADVALKGAALSMEASGSASEIGRAHV